MNIKTIYLLLGITVILAAILRFSFLSSYPPGVTGDEIQQGYSAYSILQTGKDEWGDTFPLFPISFGDYRPPLYIYLSMPFVALFDLNILATRFASALFGSLSVLVIFFLTDKLFSLNAQGVQKSNLQSKKIALLASFVLALSSWHTFFSRAAWESNVGLFFFLTAVYFFLKGLEKSKYLSFSSLCFGLTIFSYYSYKLFVPIFVLGLGWIFRKKLLELPRKSFVIPFLILGVFVAVLFYGEIFTGSGRRAADAAIYNIENLVPLRNTQVSDPLPQPWGRVINNKQTYLFTQFAQNYLGYFSTTFLASPNRPDSSLYNLPGQWLLSIWELAFVLIAVFLMLKVPQHSSKLLLLWVVTAPIPAALTRNYMHTQRVEVMLAIFPILTAFGMYSIYHSLKRSNTQLMLSLIIFGVIFYSLAVRIDYYLFHQFEHNLGGLHYGYDQAFSLTEKEKDKYQQIIFTKKHSEPHIFLAFYTKMDPLKFQSFSKDWKSFEKEGFKFVDQTNYHLDKYYFTNIEWDKIKHLKNTLVVATPEELPDLLKNEFEVKDPFGNILFEAVDPSKQQ